MKGLIGKKIGMTQIYDDNGVLTPVTVIQAGPCTVVDVKTVERDGYSSVLLGFGKRKEKNVGKAVAGQAKAAKLEDVPASMHEFRFNDDSKFEIGSTFDASVFAEGEFLDITGITKGRGFSGVMVRWHFGGGRDGHGGGWHRKPGSIGCRETPGNIIKGKKMPGQLGNVKRTVQNLRIMKIDAERSLIFVSGAIPGANGGTVLVKKAKKK